MAPTLKTAAGLEKYMEVVCLGEPTTESVKADIEPYLSSNFKQTRNGNTTDYEGSIQHLVQLRGKMGELHLDIEDFVVDESKGMVASRHMSWGKLKDGIEFKAEVCLFIELDKKGEKAVRITEVSR